MNIAKNSEKIKEHILTYQASCFFYVVVLTSLKQNVTYNVHQLKNVSIELLITRSLVTYRSIKKKIIMNMNSDRNPANPVIPTSKSFPP